MTSDLRASLEEENDQVRVRIEKRHALEEEGLDPYPTSYPVTHTSLEAIALYREEAASEEIAVAGRVVAKRKMGRSTFFHLQDRSGRVQVYVKQDKVGEDAYERLSFVDLGDFLGAHGTMFKTKTGEITLFADEWMMLAKALRPLPEKWHGLVDKELRFRQRYLDLVANEEVRRLFVRRSRMITAMRRVLDAKEFLEVETPVLQPIYGGANARPFRTMHNALGMTLYLRIANELYLKRCLVGGLERVYEFGKDFRNEGMDRTHQPEFTQVEVYEAYANYEAGMRLTEELVGAAAAAANGALSFPFEGKEIDLSPPWDRVGFFDGLEQAVGEDLSSMDEKLLRRTCRDRGVEVEPDASAGKMLDELFSELVGKKLVRPTFVIDHPKLLSPLAKAKPSAPHLVERFEPYLGGLEIGNGFSELNDPLEQRARFEEQLAQAGRDEDRMILDEPFLRAMEHGMPPASGLGLGIDRLAMLLTGSTQLREVILFPAMRLESGDSAAASDESP